MKIKYWACLPFLLCACMPHTKTLKAHSFKTPPTQHVVLLLPQSGPLKAPAKAIQDRFLKQYYAHANKTTLEIFDTQTADMDTLYQKAREHHATLLIGPLEKKKLTALIDLSPKIPVLALNQVDAQNTHVVQFSLSPKDDVACTTQWAQQKQLHKALLFTTNQHFSQHLKKLYETRSTRRGFQIVDTFTIHNSATLPQQMKKALQYEEKTVLPSEEEDTTVSPEAPEAPPIVERSHRDDFDVIFLALPPNLARQVKSLLKFYDVTHIPIYTTSVVYEGTPNPTLDRDLNGIHFCEMPGILKHRFTQPLIRFKAFGQDAYALSQQLETLSSKPFHGETGRLSLPPSGHIHRALLHATFRAGIPHRAST